MKPINTKKQYESALKRLENIFDAKRGTKDFDEAEVLIILIEDYETRHFPIDAPRLPQDCILWDVSCKFATSSVGLYFSCKIISA